jgi:hypothetical protein
MNGSDPGKKKQSPSRRMSPCACLAGSAVFVVSLVVGVATPAAAQGIWDPDYVGGPPPIPPRDVGRPTAWAAPPPPPYSYYPPAPYSNRPPTPYYSGGNPPPGPYDVSTPYNAPTPLRVSIAEMRRNAEAEGLRLLGKPHRQGRVYVAFAEDGRGLVHHLTFDGYEGALIDNEATGVSAKPVLHRASLNTETTTLSPKPSVNPQTTAVSPKPSVNPDGQHKNPTSQTTTTQQSTTTQQAAQKALSSSAVKDQELTPIKPQPGVKTSPLPDNEIDKD